MTEQKLVDYIKKNKKQGFSDDQIKKTLLKAGWKEKDVNEGFKMIAKVKPQIKGPKPKWLIPVIVVAGIVVLGLIAWGGYELFKPSPPIGGPEGEEQLLPGEEKEFTNWKTYRNEGYGFEVKYPGDWDYKEGEGHGIGSFWKEGKLIISNSDWWRNLDIRGEVFEEAVKSSEPRMFLGDEENVLLSSKKIIDTDKTIGFLSEWEVTTPAENIIYEAIGDFEDKTQAPIITKGGPYKTVISFLLIFDSYKKEFEQILSTFKFLD